MSDDLIAAESNRALTGSFYGMDSASPLLGKAFVSDGTNPDRDTDVIYTTGRDGSENGAVKIDDTHGIKLDVDKLNSAYGYTVSYWVKMTSDDHEYNAPQLFIASPDNLWSWVGVLSDGMWCSFNRWGAREMKLNNWQMITLTVSKKHIASIYADGTDTDRADIRGVLDKNRKRSILRNNTRSV